MTRSGSTARASLLACTFFLLLLHPAAPVRASPMEYFPLSPGSSLFYNSTSNDETWLTKRYVAEDWEFINGWIWGTFTVKWSEARMNLGEADYTWINHMWIAKAGNTLTWWGFEDANARIIVTSGLNYVTEPVTAGAVHRGTTTGTLVLKESGTTIPFVPFSANYTIEAIESLTLPGGTFDNCIRVYEEETTPDGNIRFWVWYAPGVGAVKYLYPDQANRTDVLLSFHVNTENDPWDTWFMPHVPLVAWFMTIATGVVIAVVITRAVMKKRKNA